MAETVATAHQVEPEIAALLADLERPSSTVSASVSSPSTCAARAHAATMIPTATSTQRTPPSSIEVTSAKHGMFVRRFGEHLIKTRLLPRALGTSLNGMPELRRKADYGGAELALADAERASSEAEAFVEAVERMIRG
jgi:hypothetical protein